MRSTQHILCVVLCALQLLPLSAWSGSRNRVFSLADVERIEAAARKKKAEEERIRKEEEERRKSAMDRDQENYRRQQKPLKEWLENAMEVSELGLTWDERLLALGKTSFYYAFEPSLDALAVNLANAYLGKPAIGIREMMPLGYREGSVATPQSLMQLTENTILIASLIVMRSQSSPRKSLKLMGEFADKFSEHAKITLPQVPGIADSTITDGNRLSQILSARRTAEILAHQANEQKKMESLVPGQVASWVVRAREERKNHSDFDARLIEMIRWLPLSCTETTAKTYLSALAKRAATSEQASDIEDMVLVAQAISIRTAYPQVKALYLAHFASAALYSVASAIFGVTASHLSAEHSDSRLIGVAVAASVLLAGVPVFHLAAMRMGLVGESSFIHPFPKIFQKIANKKQAEKLMAYFFSELGVGQQAATSALNALRSQSAAEASSLICEQLLSTSKVRVQTDGPRIAGEVLDEEFQTDIEASDNFKSKESGL